MFKEKSRRTYTLALGLYCRPWSSPTRSSILLLLLHAVVQPCSGHLFRHETCHPLFHHIAPFSLVLVCSRLPSSFKTQKPLDENGNQHLFSLIGMTPTPTALGVGLQVTEQFRSLLCTVCVSENFGTFDVCLRWELQSTLTRNKVFP